MQIHLANYEPDRQGGGWTQARYLYNAFGNVSYESSDVYLITGPTMVKREEVSQAKRDGKIIVLRIDNAVRNSRNRGTGMSRLKDYCKLADVVIYQSNWAKNFLLPFTKKDGPVILNGVDPEKFNDKNRYAKDDNYLYIRSSRDEGKQWIMAWYYFVNNPGKLEIVGRFSTENVEYNFDFYNDERIQFMGQQSNMADVYKRNKYFLYTYLNDACSNTLLEAKASGCEIVDVYGMLQTGGAPEIMACQDISLHRMLNEYKEVLAKL